MGRMITSVTAQAEPISGLDPSACRGDLQAGSNRRLQCEADARVTPGLVRDIMRLGDIARVHDTGRGRRNVDETT